MYFARNNYLLDGVLDIDNNAAERAMPSVVLGRKNYLFAGSDKGAGNAAVIYSLIETCKALKINKSNFYSKLVYWFRLDPMGIHGYKSRGIFSLSIGPLKSSVKVRQSTISTLIGRLDSSKSAAISESSSSVIA
jgi:hypothetical protein